MDNINGVGGINFIDNIYGGGNSDDINPLIPFNANPTFHNITVTNNAIIGNNLSVGGDLAVSGNETISGTLTVTGNETITGSLSVTGPITGGIEGNITVPKGDSIQMQDTAYIQFDKLVDTVLNQRGKILFKNGTTDSTYQFNTGLVFDDAGVQGINWIDSAGTGNPSAGGITWQYPKIGGILMGNGGTFTVDGGAFGFTTIAGGNLYNMGGLSNVVNLTAGSNTANMSSIGAGQNNINMRAGGATGANGLSMTAVAANGANNIDMSLLAGSGSNEINMFCTTVSGTTGSNTISMLGNGFNIFTMYGLTNVSGIFMTGLSVIAMQGGGSISIAAGGGLAVTGGGGVVVTGGNIQQAGAGQSILGKVVISTTEIKGNGVDTSYTLFNDGATTSVHMTPAFSIGGQVEAQGGILMDSSTPLKWSPDNMQSHVYTVPISRAAVCFSDNGVAITIAFSENVTSVNRLGVGLYSLTFTDAIGIPITGPPAGILYYTTGSVTTSTGGGFLMPALYTVNTSTTGYFNINDSTNTPTNNITVCHVLFSN